MTSPPGWYPDPGAPGGQRYFDGQAWTRHTAAPLAPYPPPYGYGFSQPPWKGAQLGRPAAGPGSLASPGTRLLARLLDAAVLLPLALLVTVPFFVVFFLRAPDVFNSNTNQVGPPPVFFGFQLLFFGSYLLLLGVILSYEALLTQRYGRTLGKRWMRIRPLRVDGGPLTTGQCWGRPAISAVAGFASILGLLDPLWCCWDEMRQCLHDKVVSTIVVHD